MNQYSHLQGENVNKLFVSPAQQLILALCLPLQIKVLLEQSYVHLLTCYLGCFRRTTKLSNGDTDCVTLKPYNTY